MHANMAAVACQEGHCVENLYALYDALVSINVPNERARAVVDAMERDMFSQLATKADLRHLTELMSKDMQALHQRIDHQTTVMTVRLGAISVTTVGALYTLFKLL
jgi:hypothetical protein